MVGEGVELAGLSSRRGGQEDSIARYRDKHPLTVGHSQSTPGLAQKV